MSRTEIALLAAITLLGAALRAYRLDAADLWLDEANTVLRAAQPIDRLLAELATEDVHPPLFYLLVQAPLAVAPTEVGLRALPWLFGVLAVPLAWLVARDLGGRASGLAAALLAAVSAPLVAFSQEGRMYSLLALLELAATWSLVRALEGGGRRWWTGFALVSAAALLTHNLAGLFFAAHLAAALLAPGRRPRRSAAAAGAASLALYAPWLPLALGQVLAVESGDGWLGQPPPWWTPVTTFLNLLGGTELRNGLLSPRFAVDHLYLFGGAIALLVFGWQRLQHRPIARLVLLATGFGPVALALALSQFTRIYVDKTFLVGALLIAIVVGVAFPSDPPRRRLVAPGVALALLLVAQLWAVTAGWATPHEDYRGLVRALAAQHQPADAVWAVPGFLGRPLRYYLGRAGWPLEVHEANATRPDDLPTEAPPRLWVVSGGTWHDLPSSAAALAWRERAGYRPVREQLFPDEGLRLTLYERAP